jgi:hypothetical protein
MHRTEVTEVTEGDWDSVVRTCPGESVHSVRESRLREKHLTEVTEVTERDWVPVRTCPKNSVHFSPRITPEKKSIAQVTEATERDWRLMALERAQ